MLRERAGAGEVTLELPAGARVQDALDSLAEVTAGVPVVMAVILGLIYGLGEVFNLFSGVGHKDRSQQNH